MLRPVNGDAGQSSSSNNSVQQRLFRESKSIALERWSRGGVTTKERLLKASRIGDRLGIVRIVSELLAERCCEIQDYYEGKDEAKALELLEVGKLTEALTWAPSSSKLFGLILARRIRHYYDSGELARCSRDCCYMEQRQLADAHGPDDRTAEIETLLFHANCSNATGEHELARNKLNEAMRRINELAAASVAEAGKNDSAAASIKTQILQSCLIPPARHSTTLPTTHRPDASTIPCVGGKPHQFFSCCSNALALSRDRTRGRFLYAKRNIKPGSVLIVDRPYSFSTDISALDANCNNCHLSFRLAHVTRIPCKTCSTITYCSEECSQLAWNRFHKFECRIFKYFYENDLQKCNALLAYRIVVRACFQTPIEERNDSIIINKNFLRLHENDKDLIDIMSSTSMKRYEPDNYETVFSLETHCSDQQLEENLENAIYSIFLARCLIYCSKQLGLKLDYSNNGANEQKRFESTLAVAFLHIIQAIKCNAYEIVENVRNEETKVLEPRNIGGAIYTSVSLTNHSCYPNVVRHCFPNGVVVVTSLRFIPKGAEILDCYGQHFLAEDRDHRRRCLKMKYCFECKCEACSFDWPIAKKLENNDFRFKCKRCLKPLQLAEKLENTVECVDCRQNIGINKLKNTLQSSIQEKRITALTKMYDGFYSDALPLLLEHSNCIEKILLEPNLETVKTQQSIIQCLNAMSSTSV